MIDANRRARIRPTETSRSVAEWVGKTPDSMPPPHVRARIFAHWSGRCHLSGWKIGPADHWDLDHIKPLSRGGENRETNLAPALRDKHREKTAACRTEDAKADRMKAKHLGLHKPKKAITAWRRFDGTVVRRDA